VNAAHAWSAEQQRLLAALGVPLMVRAAAQAPTPTRAGPPDDAAIDDPALASLRAALERAAGGRNIASLLLDLRRVRASAAAKRALWPALRALRRGG
jgi:hypothetical protein